MILPAGKQENMWYSSVLKISEQDFIKYSATIHEELVTVRDSNDNEPPPFKLD